MKNKDMQMDGVFKTLNLKVNVNHQQTKTNLKTRRRRNKIYALCLKVMCALLIQSAQRRTANGCTASILDLYTLSKEGGGGGRGRSHSDGWRGGGGGGRNRAV